MTSEEAWLSRFPQAGGEVPRQNGDEAFLRAVDEARRRAPRIRARIERQNRRVQDSREKQGKRERVRQTGSRLVTSLLRLRAAEARMTLAESAILAELVHLNRYESLGFVRQSDFAVEVLGLSPRTMRRRLALHEVMETVPELERPFNEGRVGVSQILAIRDVVTRDNASIWVKMAEGRPVHEVQSLARRVKKKREQAAAAGAENSVRGEDALLQGNDRAENSVRGEDALVPGSDPPEDDPLEEPRRRRISFLSPQVPAFAIEHGLESAKRTLGWEAPRDECLEAVLAEGESSLALGSGAGGIKAAGSGAGGLEAAGSGAAGPGSAGPGAATAGPGGADAGEDARCRPREVPVWHHKYAIKAARGLLKAVDRTLTRIGRLAPSPDDEPPPSRREALHHLTPGALVDRYLALQQQKNPVRILIARALHRLDSLGAARLLGYESAADLGAKLLDVTPRSARDLLTAGYVLDLSPPLADAFARGHVGFGQVVVLGKTWEYPSPQWIRRARHVTARQYRREVRLLRRLRDAVPHRLGFEAEAFPRPDLESRLRRRLFEIGWNPAELDREFGKQGILSPPGASTDPAENPALMARLEMLVDLLAMERLRREDVAPVSVVGKPGFGKLLSVPGRHRRVTVWAREPIAGHWDRVHGDVLARCGDIPDWAVATLLVKAAQDEWDRIDPDRIPTEREILERDGYLCQAPGCSSRRMLEVHHVIFRSRGGPDEPWNLVTLCMMHHRHAVHRHTLRVTGRAPYALTWEMGLPCSERPLTPGTMHPERAAPRWVYRGERLQSSRTPRRSARAA